MVDRALVLAVNSFGGELLEDNGQYTNRFGIKSETSTRKYTIAQHKTTKVWSCGCMGWIRHRRCKHLDEMMPSLRLIGTSAEPTSKPAPAVRRIGR